MGIQAELSDDMVDRVERAIRRKLFGYVETLDVAIAAAIHSAARAAIEAMREPTDAMCEAAEWHQQPQYQRAIDAALNEKSPTP